MLVILQKSGIKKDYSGRYKKLKVVVSYRQRGDSAVKTALFNDSEYNLCQTASNSLLSSTFIVLVA